MVKRVLLIGKKFLDNLLVNTFRTSRHSDLIIVGAGIIGSAHAMEALRKGYSVRVLERDHAAVGASIRNFGHACITAQADAELSMAQASREGWIRAAHKAGFWAPEAGALVVARRDEEMEVLEQFRDTRGSDAAKLLTAEEVTKRLASGVSEANPSILGGAFLPQDLRVDPRTTVASLAQWIAAQDQAEILWNTTVSEVSHGTVKTTRGTYTADHVIVCVGHDVDYLFPSVAERWEIVRCALQMILAAPLPEYALDSAVLTGTSMLRYGGFAATPAASRLRQRITEETPELLDIVANVMFTRRPDGSLLLGDSHEYAPTVEPFLQEDTSQRLLDEICSVLGVARMSVKQRWQGVYASSPITNVVSDKPDPQTTVTTVTSGIGMTLCFGLAEHTLERL